MGVLDGFRTVSIYLVESAHPLRIHMRIGGVSAHATSTGKILLAALPPDELARRLVGRRLTSLTGRTIKRRSALHAELRRVRDQGYAIDDEECSLGLRCVGAPVRDHRGTVLAALSMVAPCHRLPPDNAVDFSPPGGRVEVRVGREGGRAVLEVLDAGRGIPEANRERIFERFFSDPPETTGHRHLGLGLNLVRTIAERYGGRVEFTNRAAGGARFRVEWPLAGRAGDRG